MRSCLDCFFFSFCSFYLMHKEICSVNSLCSMPCGLLAFEIIYIQKKGSKGKSREKTCDSWVHLHFGVF
jgi:hypothetical protein